MENMIKKIVDADNEAKAMEKDTLEEKEELSKTIEAETKKIYDDFMAKAEEVVKRNDIQEAKKAEQQWNRGMATSQISCNNGIDKKASHVPL
jgi:2-oxoglutarate dehydrogenase complex dehydrogenase (E1) component-like enzyme